MSSYWLKITNFSYPPFSHPLQISGKTLRIPKLYSVCGSPLWRFCDLSLRGCDTIPQCDRRTDGWVDALTLKNYRSRDGDRKGNSSWRDDSQRCFKHLCSHVCPVLDHCSNYVGSARHCYNVYRTISVRLLCIIKYCIMQTRAATQLGCIGYDCRSNNKDFTVILVTELILILQI